MKPRYLLELILLAALWGASFLFMRMGAPEFGPVALIALRTGIAALFLFPFILASRKLAQIRPNAGRLLFVGAVGNALPFCLLSYATLSVSAGYASILNATAPIFAAIVAWVWVGDRLSMTGLAGLFLGFIGVVVMVFDDQGNSADVPVMPVLAGVLATFCYGLGANFSKQKLNHIHPIASAFGSQLGAALTLLPFSVWLWPSKMPGADAWMAVIILGVASTGIAFILFFRLIANVGVHKTISVTYLIPLFAMIWGMIFLQESITLLMLVGGALILAGVSLTTGVFQYKIKKQT